MAAAARLLYNTAARCLRSPASCGISIRTNVNSTLSSSTVLCSGGQARWMATKSQKNRRAKHARRAALLAQGIDPNPPPPSWYIPKSTPVINAKSREETLRDNLADDKRFAQDIRDRIEARAPSAAVVPSLSHDEYDSPDAVVTSQKVLRFHFAGLEMSDKVQRLLDLTNGSQKEVVAAQKARGMELFQRREGDTGSSAVQVVALTTRIQQLQTHLLLHRKDFSSKRGLDALYVRRRKLLDYMERKEYEDYKRVVKTLGLVR